MEKDPEIIRTSLRIPKGMYDKLSASAETRGLTMHADILRRLQETLEMDDYQPVENANPDVFESDLGKRQDEVAAAILNLASKLGVTEPTMRRHLLKNMK